MFLEKEWLFAAEATEVFKKKVAGCVKLTEVLFKKMTGRYKINRNFFKKRMAGR